MRLRKTFGVLVLCGVTMATYPMLAQGSRDQNGGQQRPPNGGGNQPGQGNRPNPGGGNRPSPGGGNRPSPGNGNRPGPNPGQRPGQGHSPVKPARPVRPVQPARPGRPGRPPHWGQRPSHRPSYSFRPNDRGVLLRYYGARLRAINRARRPHFAVGGFFPYTYIPYLSPIPPDVYGGLPPVPPGYAMGYYDGYVVVYDPVSYIIINLIDLL